MIFKFRIVTVFLLSFLFVSCASKQAYSTLSTTIILKTPNMKFYDKGFINKYDNYIHLQIFEVGHIALDIKIYKDEVCRSSLECMSSKEFNKMYLHSSYEDNFLYNLFSNNKIYHKDRQNNILIKVK